MGHHDLSTSLDLTLQRFVDYFEFPEHDDFIALEFLLSSVILREMRADTMFAEALREAEATFPLDNATYHRWGPPKRLADIVRLTRDRVWQAKDDSEKREIVRRLISEKAPDFLREIRSAQTESEE